MYLSKIQPVGILIYTTYFIPQLWMVKKVTRGVKWRAILSNFIEFSFDYWQKIVFFFAFWISLFYHSLIINFSHTNTFLFIRITQKRKKKSNKWYSKMKTFSLLNDSQNKPKKSNKWQISKIKGHNYQILFYCPKIINSNLFQLVSVIQINNNHNKILKNNQMILSWIHLIW